MLSDLPPVTHFTTLCVFALRQRMLDGDWRSHLQQPILKVHLAHVTAATTRLEVGRHAWSTHTVQTAGKQQLFLPCWLLRTHLAEIVSDMSACFPLLRPLPFDPLRGQLGR